MSTYTDSLGLEEITPGDQAGLWGNTTNNNLALIDQAVTGVTPISFAGLSGTVRTLDAANGAIDEARAAVLNITGNATGSNTIIVPNKQKTYLVRNSTGQTVNFRTASPAAGGTYPLEAGNSILIFCDGNNSVFTGIISPSAGTLPISQGGTGATTFTAGFVISPGGTTALTTQAAIGIGGTATNQTTGQLQVASGGTGATTLTSGGVLRGSGTSAVSVVTGTAGVGGQVLTWNGSQWEAAAPTAAGITSISAGAGITVNGGSGPVTSGAITIAASGGSVSSVGATAPLASSGGSSPNISLSGVVPVANGGTGASSLAAAGIATTSSLSSYALLSGASFTGVVSSTGNINCTAAGGFSALQSNNIGLGSFTNTISSTNSGNIFYFNTGGNFGSVYFTTSGNFQASNSPNWSTVSDANIKTNLRPISSALNKLNSLNPTHFEYKDKLGKTQTGFIAQEFETIFPGHAIETEAPEKYKQYLPEGQETIKALDINLTAYLVKAIQELSAKVDAQAEEIAALKAK